METYLIVGLGNPGKEYDLTRHNAGFMALDILAEHLQTSWQNWQGAKAEYFLYCDEGRCSRQRSHGRECI